MAGSGWCASRAKDGVGLVPNKEPYRILMKPKFAVSAILRLMTASLAQTGTAQQAEDLYQMGIRDR